MIEPSQLLQLLFGFLLAVGVAVAANRLHSLSRSGAVSAAVIGTVIFGMGGWQWAVILLTFFISSSLLIPALKSIPLGFISSDVPRNAVPGVQLLLLPIISFLFYIISWVAGLYFFRRPTKRILAYFTWGSSALSGLLFLLAVLFIISTPV